MQWRRAHVVIGAVSAPKYFQKKGKYFRFN